MKILSLSVSNIYRPRDGTALTVYNRWMRLGKKHQVTMVVANVDEIDGVDPGIVPPEEYAERVITVPGVPSGFFLRLERKMRRSVPWVSRETGFWLNREVRYRVNELLQTEKFDFINVEPFPMFWALPSKIETPIAFYSNDILSRFVMDCVNSAQSPVERFWYQRQYAHLRKLELMQWQRAKAIFTLTELERGLILKDLPGAPVYLAPNGVNLDFLQPSGEAISQNEIVFIGALNVEQNIDAITWYGSEAFHLVKKEAPQAKLTVVGRQPAPEVNALQEISGIEVAGEVPDIRPYLNRAHVVIAPVRLGAGMKGKTIEAMAMKKPVISTTFAAEGVKYIEGENLLLADTPEEMARETIRVLRDPDLARKLGENGRRLVEEEYSWDGIVKGIEQVYEKMMAR